MRTHNLMLSTPSDASDFVSTMCTYCHRKFKTAHGLSCHQKVINVLNSEDYTLFTCGFPTEMVQAKPERR